MPKASTPKQPTQNRSRSSPPSSSQSSSSSSSSASSHPPITGRGPRKPRSSSTTTNTTTPLKPRLTAHQKSDNHKEAENRRRNGIRDQYVALSYLVPGTEGQAKSEEKMLVKTAEYMMQLLDDRRALTAQLETVGGNYSDLVLSDNEWGGSEWDPKCEREYLRKRAERIAEQGYDEADEIREDGGESVG